MSGHEIFNLETTPYVFSSMVGTTDGTTSEQIVGTTNQRMHYHDEDFPAGSIHAPSAYKCEPGQQDAINAGFSPRVRRPYLSDFRRFVFTAVRAGGTGPWTCRVRLARLGSTSRYDFPTETMPDTNDATRGMFIYDGRQLPADFMRDSPSGDSFTDDLIAQFFVTPGDAPAQICGFTFALLPGRGTRPFPTWGESFPSATQGPKR